MSASVVVPTRDRPAALRRCLAAVGAQRNVTLDVVVVDDGSVARAAVAAVAEEFGARLVRLEGAGPAAARNAGVAAARADRILLLDDDCLAQPGWAEALAGAAARAPHLVVAGTVLPPPRATAWLRASERIALHAEAASGFFRTLNVACGRELLLHVPFDERFPSAAGEDRDWCVRALRAGAQLERVEAAIVVHDALLGPVAFGRQQMGYGRAVARLRRAGTHVAAGPRSLASLCRSGFDEGLAVGLAVVAAQAVTAGGYAVESMARRPR